MGSIPTPGTKLDMNAGALRDFYWRAGWLDSHGDSHGDHAPLSTESITAAVSRCIVGVTWLYRSSVIAIDE